MIIVGDANKLREIVMSQAAVVFFVREADPDWGDEDMASGIEGRCEKVVGITYRFQEGDYWEDVLRISCNVAVTAFSKGKLLHLTYGPVPFITINALEAAMSMIYEVVPARKIARGFTFLGHEHVVEHIVQDLGHPYETYLVSEKLKLEDAHGFEVF